MESLKSQFGLRSMDMEGRSLGTERPSVSIGRTASESSEVRSRFTSLLAERTRGGTRAIQGTSQAVEDDVASRIRDGRTDAAETGGEPRESVRDREADAASPERDENGPEGERGRREDPESRRSREDTAGDSKGDSGGDGELSSKERGNELTDASDAQGAESDDPSDAHAPTAPGQVLPQAPPPPKGGIGAAAMNAPKAMAQGGPAAAFSAVGRVLPKGQFNAVTGSQQAKAAAAKGAAPTSSAPRPGAAAMERAEAILEQLKVRIQSGGREARLQLRPVDLGRLDVHIKVDGGQVTASIAAESAETLSVLEAHAPELRAWLSKDGTETVELELYVMDDSAKEEHPQDMPGQDGQGRTGTGGRDRPGSGPSLNTAPSGPLRAALGASLDSQSQNPSRLPSGVDLVG